MRGGAALDPGGAWCAALLGAAFAAGAYWLERRPRVGALVRAADGKLGLEGRLVTSFEWHGRGPLARLLEAGVLRELSRARLLRASVPTSIAFVALPLLGGVLLALALEARRLPAPEAAWLATLAAGLDGATGSAASAAEDAWDAGALALEDLAAVHELAREARELARASASSGAAGTLPAAQDLERLRERLTHLAGRAAAGAPEVARELERAATFADGAALGLERAARAGETPRREGAAVATDSAETGEPAEPGGLGEAGESGAPVEPAARGAADASGGAGGNEGPGVAQPGASGRMSTPSPAPSVPPDRAGPEDLAGPDASPGLEPGGTSTGRWWTDHDAGLVARWVEIQRSRAREARSGRENE